MMPLSRKKVPALQIRAAIITIGLLMIISLSTVEPSYAAGLPEGKWIISEMEKKNAEIRDFSVSLNISLYALLMNFPIRAKLYFKRPDKVKMVFLNIPDILKGHENEFKAAVPSETLRKKYRCKVMGKETVDEEILYILKMNPVEEGNLKQAYVWVHSKNFTPEKFYLTYRNGSIIEVENEFKCQEGFLLIKKQKIRFDLPQINADARITYSNYRLNQNLPDSLFEDKKDEKKNDGEDGAFHTSSPNKRAGMK